MPQKKNTGHSGELATAKEAPAKRTPDPVTAILLSAQKFMAEADAIEEVLEVATPVLKAKAKEHVDELERMVDEAKVETGDEEGDDSPTLRLDMGELDKLVSLTSKIQRGAFLFRGHLLVALVSRFDSFVAEITKVLLSRFPERLGKRTVTYSEATQFNSMDELRERFIDDEIEARMRESHEEQIEYLSNLANVPLLTNEPDLHNAFIEITERRNCHIHSEGRVSPQYLRVCRAHQVNLDPSVKLKTSLNVNGSYLHRSRRTLSEVAFKAAQTIARKCFTNSNSLADAYVDATGLNLLRSRRWEEALMIFDYASQLRQGWVSDETSRRNNIINKAQALIGIGRRDEAMKAVEAVDWSASHPKYLMAIHLLKQEFEDAAKFMANAGLGEDAYRKWPIFNEFRSTDVFKRTFASIFAKDFDKSSLGELTNAVASITKNASGEELPQALIESPHVEDPSAG